MSDLDLLPSISHADQRIGWNPVLESQLGLLREGRFSDVTFIVGPSKERIPCHQIFLKSRSPVFQVMFSERWNNDKDIPLEDVEPKIFTKFLEFMYADNFDVTVPEALGLLQVAHKYDVHLLVDKCEKLLESETTVIDAVDVFQAARKYGKIRLMDKIGDLMSKSLSELQSFPSFSRLDKETLEFIVKRNDLKKFKEVDLFRLALQWATNQCGLTAQESLQDVLPHIRFPVMTLEEFTRTVVPTGVLSQSQVIELFIYFGSDVGTKKSLADNLEFSTQRRRLPDATVSVPIYRGKYEIKDGFFQGFERLRECLQFYTRPNPGSYLGCNDGTETTVGLNGITIHWPFARIPECLRNYDQNYRELLAMSPVEMEDGKVTEVKFETAIPMKHGTLYCIILKEVPPKGGFPLLSFYSSFRGNIADSVEVNIDDKCQVVFDIHRNQLNEFTKIKHRKYVFDPRFICKLGFEEL